MTDTMRRMMLLLEAGEEVDVPTPLPVSQPVDSPDVLADLKEVVATMRTYVEEGGGTYSEGFEDGLQRAAGMVESVIRKHEVTDVA